MDKNRPYRSPNKQNRKIEQKCNNQPSTICIDNFFYNTIKINRLKEFIKKVCDNAPDQYEQNFLFQNNIPVFSKPMRQLDANHYCNSNL